MLLRPYVRSDRDGLLRANNAAVPAVSSLDEAALDDLVAWAHSVTVAESDGGLAGFLILLTGPGSPYPSENYRWLSDRYDNFLYVDRIVVDPDRHRGGVGRRLYEHAISVGTGDHPVLVAEVNLRPRNEGSLAFHERFEFRSVGEADTDGGAKRVVYLERRLR